METRTSAPAARASATIRQHAKRRALLGGRRFRRREQAQEARGVDQERGVLAAHLRAQAVCDDVAEVQAERITQQVLEVFLPARCRQQALERA
jgi:hypothetical protein